MKPVYLATMMLASLASYSEAASNSIYNDVVGHKGIYYSAGAYCAYETLTYWECGIPCEQNAGLTEII